jgi:DNA-binding CsgD family transcriptional regulator
MGGGRIGAAIACFDRQREVLRARAIEDADLYPEPELVELLLRVGAPDRAAALAAEYRQRATAKGQPWALGRAARGTALAASAEDYERHFVEALELHARTPDRFEAARTELAFGARLRRERQRVRARTHLRRALESFETLGSAPWAEMARAELAATGETARRRDVTTQTQLTPQELQIALLLGSGHTTRDAASRLFVSPKTIEYHLRSIYRKLEINSRDELAKAMAE